MMLAATTKEFTLSVPAAPERLRTVRLATRRLDATTVVITVAGEIDAANTDALTNYLTAAATPGSRLVLDTTSLDFFAIEGVSTLQGIGDRFSAGGVRWVLVPGAAVARVLRVCDPQGSLPTATTVETALTDVADRARRPLVLVAR